MNCVLCKRENVSLAKAHIFPIGFFNKIGTKGQVLTYRTTSEKGRRLQKAIYDEEIVCHQCEHDILMPLDDYAIKILQDKEGVIQTVVHPERRKANYISIMCQSRASLRFDSGPVPHQAATASL
ncbi:MAG: hypothetical protein M1497_16035 [Nitrospirae bacterium]|nr:hypothetical protein [Nitrospirota bacterium]